MTHVVINLDEPTWEDLYNRARRLQKSPEQLAAFQLKAALAQLPDAGRALVVTGDSLQNLEDMLSGGSLLSQEDLVRKVARLAGVSFLHVRLPFTPNQLEELERKAASQGWTVEQLVERTAPRIYEQFFDLMARV